MHIEAENEKCDTLGTSAPRQPRHAAAAAKINASSPPKNLSQRAAAAAADIFTARRLCFF